MIVPDYIKALLIFGLVIFIVMVGVEEIRKERRK